MKRVCESSADRITDLPADVIKRVLVFLPTKDAAKTSILSRKWRYYWRSIPQLVFDHGFVHIPEDIAEPEWNVMSKQVMLNVYKSLIAHDGPITKFVFSIPGLFTRDEIDHILLYLSDKGVEDLSLVFWEGTDNDIDLYRMHSSLFSALHLKSLVLHYCEVTPPPSRLVGFSKLTHLDLEHVTLPCDFFEKFLPKCPMLECLKIIYCKGPTKLEIVAPFLTSFEFTGSFQDICF